MDSRTTEYSKENQLIVPGKLGLWLLISLLFTVIQIQHSLREGRLAFPPIYDDISYFNDALMRLQAFYEGGFLKLIPQYIQHPPHSLLSTLIPFSGFALLGIKDWAPSVINLLLIFFTLIFIDYLTKGLSMPQKVLIALAALAWPIMGHLIIECRPDIFCGLLTASFVVLITEKPWLIASKKRHFIIGSLIGAALLAKPTISPVTLILALSAMGLVTMIEVYLLKYKVSPIQIIMPGVRSLGLAILIALPYYLFAFKQVVEYIYLNQFVNLRKVWQMENRPFLEDVQFYLTGQGGHPMMSHFFYLWLFIALVTVAVITFKKEWKSMVRVPALAGTILIAYTIVTASDHKSPFLGVVIACFFFITYVMLLTYLVQSSRTLRTSRLQKLSQLGIISFLVINLIVFQWPAALYGPRPSSLEESRYYRQQLDSIYQDINQNLVQDKENNFRVYISSASHSVNFDVVRYEFNKKDDLRFVFDNDALSDDIDSHLRKIKESDYIITFNADNPEVYDWIPSRKVQSTILNFLETQPGYSLIEKYISPYSKGEVFLYVHERTAKE
jgi:hypothetical protein